jgi:hypothetical protein|tara:strand:+ start:1299 stop:1835 length:537 start_codon:yes stop_codon:yes gene_type:complete
MLNKIKKISKFEKRTSTPTFFDLPKLPLDSYLQSNSKLDKLNALNLVLNESSPTKVKNENHRFSFSSQKFRNYLLLKTYFKKNLQQSTKFKEYLLFTSYLFQNRNRYPLSSLKRVKGGFMSTSLGINAFMPRSHRVSSGDRKQFLLGFKAFSKKKRFSAKRSLKINLVTSSKLPRKFR